MVVRDQLLPPRVLLKSLDNLLGLFPVQRNLTLPHQPSDRHLMLQLLVQIGQELVLCLRCKPAELFDALLQELNPVLPPVPLHNHDVVLDRALRDVEQREQRAVLVLELQVVRGVVPPEKHFLRA